MSQPLFTPLNGTRAALLGALLACALPSMAQDTKPGLWEITQKMGGSAEMDKAMAQMHQQMASMPPAQRKQMEDMMAKQGMSMGAGTGGGISVKVCLTKEMVERNEIAQPQQQGDCQSTTSARVGNTQKISFSCMQPPSSGEGQITYTSNEAYTMKMVTTTTVKGKPEKMTLDGAGKWLSADCGAIKLLAPPKK
ncbi:MAG: DUF3617 domain-containing protein [Pseudomonadota bacterium]|uniref:DUF3617 domain-containing protein n=1 Tax=Polaromonas sp. TaxID=1869339 RepID=UPI0017A981F1|nr:DUF3617 domain-containing protein [Polaromonas sp.]MBA3592463.1 DUF3617 domain-containing protein [Polaromonas sp.]MDQ3271622.1 DUF3617 domain-containing protein [Pseudomonadota bacterium]